jgi:PAS domain S-box-containing protein
MAEMLGYTLEEMMRRHLFSFMDERGKEIAQIGLDRREKGIKEQHDFEFLRKDGKRIYASLETSPMTDEAGNYTGALAVVADITERKRIEDALRESEKRYRLVVDSAAEAIIVAQDGMLRLVNPMAVAMTGLSEQELMSKPFPAFVHPDDRAMVVDTYQRRLRGEAVPARYAFRLLAKDGIIKWMEIVAVAIDWEGRPATLNFLTDITERRRAEEALMLANKKLDLMSTLTRHDALNQLSVALGYAEIARGLAKGSNVAPYIDKIMSAGEAIRGPLEFAKTYQSIGANQPEWQNIRRVFDNALSSLDLRNIVAENRLADVEVYSDMMLERIFYNLVENTLRHGTNASTIIASQSESSNGLIIVIEDDGGGVPDNEKEVIFNRGYGKHTGDGLYITREILDLTGIAIKERGVLGKGARFEILVPAGTYRRQA